MIPGEMMVADREIELNVGRKTVKVTVSNTGDRPIQVGSHFHFFETNEALSFDRAAARGFRLNIAAGTAVRFEPGQQRDVELVALAGDRIVYGFNAKVMGPLDKKTPSPAKRGAEAGFREAPASRRRSDARLPARGSAGEGAGSMKLAVTKKPSAKKPAKKGAKK